MVSGRGACGPRGTCSLHGPCRGDAYPGAGFFVATERAPSPQTRPPRPAAATTRWGRGEDQTHGRTECRPLEKGPETQAQCRRPPATDLFCAGEARSGGRLPPLRAPGWRAHAQGPSRPTDIALQPTSPRAAPPAAPLVCPVPALALTPHAPPPLSCPRTSLVSCSSCPAVPDRRRSLGPLLACAPCGRAQQVWL